MQSKPIRILPASKVFHGAKRTRSSHINDCQFFASRIGQWFVFVRDEGKDVEPKQAQMALF